MNITYIGYSYNGIGNQFCSIQTLAGLAGYFKGTNIDVVWHQNENKMQDPQVDDHNLMDTSKIDKHLDNSPITIFDLVDFDFDNVTFYEDDRHIKRRYDANLINMQKYFLNVSGNTANVEAFADGRKSIMWDIKRDNILTQTLAWYSKFFYDRNQDIDSAIRSVTFKKEYVTLAKIIARDIGKFNGIQVRIMPDHHQYYKFSKESFERGLDKLEDKSLPLLCSVDNYNHEFITSRKDKLILLEDLILENYLPHFKSLPFQNRITLALLSALVMIESADFVATPFSTFSTMILQQRHNRIGESWKYFPATEPSRSPLWIDEYDKNFKPYSWSKNGHAVVWEREWEECKLM